MSLGCIFREYPYHLTHMIASEHDIGLPRLLTPCFYGCYDWHSAVHNHWLLARVARLLPNSLIASEARAALARSLTPQNVNGEVAHLNSPSHGGFERPYGLAWVLQLAAELQEWQDASASEWLKALRPLEQIAAERIVAWLPKLTHPIRGGEHSQTAFSIGLVWDWAHLTKNRVATETTRDCTLRFYRDDRDGPITYEPSGHDFLSPCLAEADLMRRVLKPGDFASWLSGFLPSIPRDGSTTWVASVSSPDRADGKLAHLDGLNLSRAWMLEGIAAGLPSSDPRLLSLQATALAHCEVGLAAVSAEHYEGSHWLPSFAVYLVTKRGLP